MTHKEIAEKLNVSPQTINYRIGQALKILRSELKDYLPLIKKGETVTDSSTGALIGTITDVTSEKSKHVGSKITADTLGNRYISYSEYDNLYDVFVTMTVKADVDSRGIAYVNKNKVLVGSKIYFRCGTFAAASFCTAFSIE